MQRCIFMTLYQIIADTLLSSTAFQSFQKFKVNELLIVAVKNNNSIKNIDNKLHEQ